MNVGQNYSPGESSLAQKETLQGTLVKAAQILGECETVLKQINDKLRGESPQKQPIEVAAVPNGVASVALDIKNRAQQIRAVLGELSAEIA